jgi:hypothetical protein
VQLTRRFDYTPTPLRPAPMTNLPEQPEHPRGTLVIVGLFGVFFALAWLGTYVFVFLERGTLHP